MKAFCLHWTGGGYQPSALDRKSYHSLSAINEHTGDVMLIEGDKPPEANQTKNGKLDSGYVRHCGGHNSDTIGHALCGMGGDEVSERPLNTGRFPVTAKQWNHAVEECADYLEIYNIKVTEKTVFLHSEVRRLFGVGKYKWDVNYCQGIFDTLVSPKVAGDKFRADVAAELARRDSKDEKPGSGGGIMAALIAAFAAFMKEIGKKNGS